MQSLIKVGKVLLQNVEVSSEVILPKCQDCILTRDKKTKDYFFKNIPLQKDSRNFAI
jgi:hypothetical protein